MPKLILNDVDRKRIEDLLDECPCITNAALARIFGISASYASVIALKHKEKKNDTVA